MDIHDIDKGIEVDKFVSFLSKAYLQQASEGNVLAAVFLLK
jgi:hypothetical protein